VSNRRFCLAFVCANLRNLRQLGCNEAQIEKESRYAQFEARPESYPQRCAHNIEKLHRGV
jgi:hypothetical protein